MANKYLIVIGGPTAVGKTEIAIHLAKTFNTEIISADSRQIYKELNIGVAKPNEEQLQLIKHHFISHISIHQDYTAYDYQKDVHQLLPQLFQKNNVVIMVGGTGFYINAVLNGLNEIPTISQITKNTLQELYQKKGIEFLQKELFVQDPEYCSKADTHNPLRLLRALEVIYETGHPFSYFLNDKLIKKPDYFTSINIFLNMNRDKLNQKINERVKDMIKQGLKDEVRNLLPFKHLKALNTVGYKEWWYYFDGRINLNSVIQQIQKNTQQYAKRQRTWFKHQWEAYEIKIDSNTKEKLLEQISDLIQKNLN